MLTATTTATNTIPTVVTTSVFTVLPSVLPAVADTTLLWVCDVGSVLLSDPMVWARYFQVPPQTVCGRAWLLQLHPEDMALVIECFVSLLNPRVVRPSAALEPQVMTIRLRNSSAYRRYQLHAILVRLQDLTYHWVFLASSLAPTAADYAERNLLSVLTMAVSLARDVLASLTALHNATLRSPLCRRLSGFTDQIQGYLDHLEQGVRYLTTQRQRHD